MEAFREAQVNFKILSNEEINDRLHMSDVLPIVEQAYIRAAEGSIISPPRLSADIGDNNKFIFTVGASKKDRIAGFRFYPTIPVHDPTKSSADRDQLMLVLDSTNGDFKGIIFGKRFGSIRTGAIGGVAMKHLSRKDSKSIGIIGSGNEARTQLEAAVSIRPIESAKVFSLTSNHRESFALEMRQKLGIDVRAVDSAKEAVNDVDILSCTTTSKKPVFDSDWLEPGMHVNSLHSLHELDDKALDRSQVLVSGSLVQMNSDPAYETILFGENRKRCVDLRDIITGKAPGRKSRNDITLFLSTALAGSELLVADYALTHS